MKANIKYESEKTLKVVYDGAEIGVFRADLVVEGKIVVEIKALEKMPLIFKRQLISQMKAAGYYIGFLVNFGSNKLEYLRIYCKNS